MVWFPSDKIITAPLIDLPKGALVIIPKTSGDGQTDFAVRFDLIVDNQPLRYLFYPNGLPWASDQSVGWALNLERWQNRNNQYAAFLDASEWGMRLECSGEILDAQRADYWSGQGRGRAFIGLNGVRLLAGNGSGFDGETIEIDPSSWRAQFHHDVTKIGWAEGWRLLYGNQKEPSIIREFSFEIASG